MEPLENEKQWKINEIARVATVPIIIAGDDCRYGEKRPAGTLWLIDWLSKV